MQFGRLDILFNNVGIPTPATRRAARGPHRRGLRPADLGEFPRRLPRQQARGPAIQEAGRRRRDRQHRVGRRSGRLGRFGVRRDQGRGAPAHPRGRHRGRAARHPRQCDLPGRHAVHQLHGRRRHEPDRRRAASSGRRRSASSHPLGRPITAEDCAEAAIFLASDRAANITGRCCRSTAGTSRDDRSSTRASLGSCWTSSGCGSSSTCGAVSSRYSAERTSRTRT